MVKMHLIGWEDFQTRAKENTPFDKLDYYKNYYKNLSPSGFDVQKEGDFIKIKIPSKTT